MEKSFSANKQKYREKRREVGGFKSKDLFNQSTKKSTLCLSASGIIKIVYCFSRHGIVQGLARGFLESLAESSQLVLQF